MAQRKIADVRALIVEAKETAKYSIAPGREAAMVQTKLDEALMWLGAVPIPTPQQIVADEDVTPRRKFSDIMPAGAAFLRSCGIDVDGDGETQETRRQPGLDPEAD